MNDRPPSAAASIYPHLKSAERPMQRPSNNSLAASMYPAHVKPPPLPADPYLAYMQKLGFIRQTKENYK
jgi:hypothetical protein